MTERVGHVGCRGGVSDDRQRVGHGRAESHPGLAGVSSGRQQPPDFGADQTRNVLERIDGLLAEAGSSREHILSATIWLADISTFDEMNAVWDAWVPAGSAPARATVEAKLAAPKYGVEIGIIAAVGA